jgi:hypothetical protein
MTTISLTTPVANGPEIIRSISLRKIKMSDFPVLMRGATLFATGDLNNLGENVLEILERLSGLPRRIIDEIDADDIEAVLGGVTAHIKAYNEKK